SRQFSTTQTCLKKKSKGNTDDTPSKKDKSPAPTSSDDPFDLTTLEDDLSKTTDKLKSDLSKLRSGGRFNPQVLETLRVQPEKDVKTSYPLQDLAQIIPRGGREIQILINDAAHIKAVTSAIQSSSLSLTPQPDPTGHNPQMLVVKIPPPTAESRKATLNEAGKAGDVAQNAVRNARGTQQKKFRKMELGKTVRPDDLKKAQGKMEEVVKKAGEEVKRIVDGAKRALD
ncbi:ribosome recycling factor-domain-containing protein, partial [Elsinoe ampelina]